MEHHANIVPWQLVAEADRCQGGGGPGDDAGELLLDAFVERITERTRMIGVAWVSNVLGTVNPVHELVRIAHARGLPILIDAAQAVQHIPVDVQELGADFLVFSGHKLYGPSGVGVLHGKAAHLEAMPPYQGGGDMIERVSFAGTTWNEIPFKFEAGTPDIAGIVALGAAIDYVEALGLDAIAAHEAEVLAYATRAINQVPGRARDRHRRREVQRADLRHGRRPPAGHRRPARPGRDRDPHRPPLRHAAARSVRASPPVPAPRSASTPAARTSTRSWPASGGPAEMLQ